MKCAACELRKGKRQCPAKSALICAQCCGEKRVLEIVCPTSCEFLKIGRQKESSMHAHHVITSDPSKYAKRRRILTEFKELFARVEMFFASERHTVRSLTDKEAAEALDLLLDTLRTEDKGIFFERTSSNPFIDGMRRRLGELITSYREPEQPDAKRLRLADVITVLELVREVMDSYTQPGSGSRGYVDTLARIYRREEGLASSGSSIIVPGW